MDAALRALAHPARLAIVRATSRREHSVGELARALDLRQPATSQHLSVLREAGLVSVRSDANRRLYRANPRELAKLRAFLDVFWQDSLRSLKAAAESRVRQGGRR